jgi:hypothetical protein
MVRDPGGLSTIRQTKPWIDTGSGTLAAADALRGIRQSNGASPELSPSCRAGIGFAISQARNEFSRRLL